MKHETCVTSSGKMEFQIEESSYYVLPQGTCEIFHIPDWKKFQEFKYEHGGKSSATLKTTIILSLN